MRHDNIGQATTLNRGYEVARGEILGYLSDDDLLAPGLVTALVKLLQSQPDAVGAYPAYHLIDGQGTAVDTWLPLGYTPEVALVCHDTIIGPGGLARREALLDGGAWDASYRWMGDLIMWMGVGRAGPVLRLDVPLASWRKHPDNATSTTGVARGSEHLRVFEHGMRLNPQVSTQPGLRAEALRNACLVGAWFAGHMSYAPHEPIYMIDQNRPLISAWASGQAPGTERFDARHAEDVANGLRRLGELTMRLAAHRVRGPAPRGYDHAVLTLRAAGALGPDDAHREVGEPAFGPTLVAAALDCGADVPLERQRFLVPDREQSAAARAEWEALAQLTLAGQAHGRGIQAAIEREVDLRREDLAREGVTP